MECPKHVENYKQINTLKRICASSWAITKNHCKMHGQQNVKEAVDCRKTDHTMNGVKSSVMEGILCG